MTFSTVLKTREMARHIMRRLRQVGIFFRLKERAKREREREKFEKQTR